MYYFLHIPSVNVIVHRSTMNEKTNFSGAIFDSIVTLKEGDANAFASLIDEARISLLASNVIDGNVSSAYLYEFLSKMNAITELEMYGKEYFRLAMTMKRHVDSPSPLRHYYPVTFDCL